MHKNRLWLLLLITVGMITLYFFGKGGVDLYNYYSLDQGGKVQQIDFEVMNQREEKCWVTATYTFEVDGKLYRKEREELPQTFYNSWSADQWISSLNTRSTRVWYQKKDPNHSSLYRSFPYKSVISAGVMLLLIVYFIGIGYYIGSNREK